jgi:hypothetical protein
LCAHLKRDLRNLDLEFAGYNVKGLLRAHIDQAILPWAALQTWKRPDFPVTPAGIVRSQATLAVVVAQRGMLGQKLVDGAVEWLVEQPLPAGWLDAAQHRSA